MCRNIVVAHYDILSGGFYLPVSAGPDGLLREVNNTVHATMVILGGQSDDVKATRTKGACVHCSVAMGRGDDGPPHNLSTTAQAASVALDTIPQTAIAVILVTIHKNIRILSILTVGSLRKNIRILSILTVDSLTVTEGLEYRGLT
jgi:hypothetical protein